MNETTLDLKQGSTWTVPIVWSSTDEPPARYDLTGYTARMQIRKGNAEGTVIADMTTANSKIVITAATQGKLELRLTATETAALPTGKHPFDLELVSGSTVVTLLEGFINVRREITRAS